MKTVSQQPAWARMRCREWPSRPRRHDIKCRNGHRSKHEGRLQGCPPLGSERVWRTAQKAHRLTCPALPATACHPRSWAPAGNRRDLGTNTQPFRFQSKQGKHCREPLKRAVRVMRPMISVAISLCMQQLKVSNDRERAGHAHESTLPVTLCVRRTTRTTKLDGVAAMSPCRGCEKLSAGRSWTVRKRAPAFSA